MVEKTLRDKLIEMLRQERQTERDLVAALSEEVRNAEQLIDQWGLKNIIAHISSAKFGIAGDLAKGRQGQDVTPFNADEQFSDRIFAQHQHDSWEEVNAYADASVDTLIAEVEHYDDPQLLQANSQTWMYEGDAVIWYAFGFGINHPYEHIAQVYAENGHPDTAYALLESLISLHNSLEAPLEAVAVTHYDIARAFTSLGQKDSAIGHLRNALRYSPALQEWVKGDSTFDVFRDDAEFQALYG